MSKIIAVLACLAVVLAVVSAESKPRYHKLEKLGCTLDQVILCAGEIEGIKKGVSNDAVMLDRGDTRLGEKSRQG